MRVEFPQELVSFLKNSLEIAMGDCGEATLTTFYDDPQDKGFLINRRGVSMGSSAGNALYDMGWKTTQGDAMEWQCIIPEKLHNRLVSLEFYRVKTTDRWVATRIMKKRGADLNDVEGSFQEVWEKLMTFE